MRLLGRWLRSRRPRADGSGILGALPAAALPALVMLLAGGTLAGAPAAWAAEAPPAGADGEIHLTRAAGPIRIDGDLSDPGWRGATRVETFYETNPGDNIP